LKKKRVIIALETESSVHFVTLFWAKTTLILKRNE